MQQSIQGLGKQFQSVAKDIEELKKGKSSATMEQRDGDNLGGGYQGRPQVRGRRRGGPRGRGYYRPEEEFPRHEAWHDDNFCEDYGDNPNVFQAYHGGYYGNQQEDKAVDKINIKSLYILRFTHLVCVALGVPSKSRNDEKEMKTDENGAKTTKTEKVGQKTTPTTDAGQPTIDGLSLPSPKSFWTEALLKAAPSVGSRSYPTVANIVEDWTQPIKDFILNEKSSNEENIARKIRTTAARYVLIDDQLRRTMGNRTT
ncbi:hypothetical protein M9H77_03038 [Catharanthus roseus]|uniref:Uncharacterized protein n=1 Tax=Catharanthus roseus TaxID=4058 RepID=A0ACC0CAA1_CATRO|nr:hypothetical protein M9H77_03038 [Catharanthus roseus]